MITIALFGAGRIASVHARNISQSPHAQLLGVYDPHIVAAEQLAKENGCQVFSSEEEIFENSQIDAVVICSPTHTHQDLVIRSAAHGKGIFCEKPVDLEIEKILTCMTHVETSGVPFLLGFNRRFDPHHRAVFDGIKSGKIGNVESVHIISRDAGLPHQSYLASSGGIFRDMTIHDFDMAQWLLAEPIAEVHATGSCLVDPYVAEVGDIDSAVITMRTVSGKLCTIHNSRRAAYGYDQRLEVFGSEGMLQSHNVPHNQSQLFTEQAVTLQNYPTGFIERYSDAYAIEMRHFIEEVMQGKNSLIGIEDGLKASLLAETAYKSLESGKVELIESTASV